MKSSYPWTFTLSKEFVEPGKKFEELTICFRVYSLLYSKMDHFHVIWFEEGDPVTVVTNGYEEQMDRWMRIEIYGPSPNPFDIVNFRFTSRKNLDKTKTEWSFFRRVKDRLAALRWNSLCFVYNKPGRNTGIVSMGEVVANQNQSDLWANDDNFVSSRMFEPVNIVSNGKSLLPRYFQSRYLKGCVIYSF